MSWLIVSTVVILLASMLLTNSYRILPPKTLLNKILCYKNSREMLLQSSFSSNNHNIDTIRFFNATNYFKELFINNKAAEVVATTVTTAQFAVEEHSYNSHIVLVDYNVRTIDDIQTLPYQFLTKFLQKLQKQNKVISENKFLFTNDIGGEETTMVSIARIPKEMYKKLDLAKRLADSHAISTTTSSTYTDTNTITSAVINTDTNTGTNTNTVTNINGVSVHMISSFGEYVNDFDMIDALISSFQCNKFVMPSMTKVSNSVALDYCKVPLTIVTDEIASDIDGSGDKKELDNITNNNSSLDREAKISSLEAAMLKAAAERDGIVSETSNVLDIEPKRKAAQEFLSSLPVICNINHGTNLARALSVLPPNVLTPKSYRDIIHDLAIANDWQFDEWSAQELNDLGCGAFFAVTQANHPHGTDRLVRLKLRKTLTAGVDGKMKFPQTGISINNLVASNAEEDSFHNQERPVVLVGKGVSYDCGGINLKGANSMKTMKHDMAGSAAALGTFLALSKLDVDYPVECWLALVENSISNAAYKPDDVVYSVTGDSIEVVHSDAEGRMLLADVLALASRKVIKTGTIHTLADELAPKLLIDYATLTGTCISSLSNRYVGAFTNRDFLHSVIVQAGNTSGERAWTFPTDDDYEEDLKSDVADILQCRQPTEADHIYAAIFLKKFVKESVPWIHLDIGSAYRAGGLGHISTDYTGVGVRLANDIIKGYVR